MDLGVCLLNKKYNIIDIYKKTEDNIILVVRKNNKKYVSKILLNVKNNKYTNMNTEINAMKFFSNLNIPFFARYHEDYICGKNHYLIMERIKGIPLIELRDKKLNLQFWKLLLSQLVIIVKIMENLNILHNDFWDANMIITFNNKKTLNIKFFDEKYYIENCDLVVKIIDYQYTNEYKKDARIYSEIVMSKNKKYKYMKKELGWSDKFHRGGDMNQILGILTEYKYFPNIIRKKIQKYIMKKKNSKYPYAIDKQNEYLSGEYLHENFNNFFGIKYLVKNK